MNKEEKGFRLKRGNEERDDDSDYDDESWKNLWNNLEEKQLNKWKLALWIISIFVCLFEDGFHNVIFQMV